MGKTENEDSYDGKFIDDQKLEDVVQDLLYVCEKWQLRTMESQIALQQAKFFIEQKQQAKNFKKNVDNAQIMMASTLKRLGLD